MGARKRRKVILAIISDLVSDFLYYDRKEDEELDGDALQGGIQGRPGRGVQGLMDFQKTWKVRFQVDRAKEEQTLVVRTNDFSQIERMAMDAWMNLDAHIYVHREHFKIVNVEFVGYMGQP